MPVRKAAVVLLGIILGVACGLHDRPARRSVDTHAHLRECQARHVLSTITCLGVSP